MVDWDQVERLRSKGWDWDRIAQDPRVEFTPDAGIEEPGRALKSLYYKRRSKSQRQPAPSAKGGKIESPEARERRWTLARVGLILTPIFAIWAILAYIYPTLVGLQVSWIILGLIAAGAGVVLAIGMLRTTHRWNTVYRNTVIAGVAIGLVVSGSFALTNSFLGCPNLTSTTVSQPGGSGNSQWLKANNKLWAIDGSPVFFFYGSVACPYCSASSWSIVESLLKFGSFSPIVYGHSSSTDVFPNTPEVVLAGTSAITSSVYWDVAESTNDQTITSPTTSGCFEQAYLAAYNPGGSIPFVVLGGIYIHTGTFVDPSQLQGLSATQVQQQIANESGVAWNAISPQIWWLCAYILKLNNGEPSSLLTQYPEIRAAYDQIP